MKSYRIYMRLTPTSVDFRIGGRVDQNTTADKYFAGQPQRWQLIGRQAAFDKKAAIEELSRCGINGPRFYKYTKED